MALSFFYTYPAWLVCTVQFVIMMGSAVVGRWVGQRRGLDLSESLNSTLTASLFGLLGLLLAFTFGLSGERYKERKQTIVEEANAIGTAILRTQLYADSVQPLFRESFKNYLEARIMYYEAATDTTRIWAALRDGQQHADKLWKIATEQSRINGNLIASNQMVPALNEMFDISTTRFWGEYNRTPTSILVMLFFLSFATSFVAGYTSVGRVRFDWLMAVSFCLLTSMVIYFIIDLDKTRGGIITLDDQHRAIVDLRKMFGK